MRRRSANGPPSANSRRPTRSCSLPQAGQRPGIPEGQGRPAESRSSGGRRAATSAATATPRSTPVPGSANGASRSAISPPSGSARPMAAGNGCYDRRRRRWTRPRARGRRHQAAPSASCAKPVNAPLAQAWTDAGAAARASRPESTDGTLAWRWTVRRRRQPDASKRLTLERPQLWQVVIDRQRRRPNDRAVHLRLRHLAGDHRSAGLRADLRQR